MDSDSGSSVEYSVDVRVRAPEDKGEIFEADVTAPSVSREPWQEDRRHHPDPGQWTREAFLTAPPALAFAAPLSSEAFDLFPLKGESGSGAEAALLFRTPEALTGRMLVRCEGHGVRVKWVCDNVLFPSAKLPAYCEHEMIVPLIPHVTEGDRQRSFIDLSMGGFACDARSFRVAQRKRQPGDPGYLLAPDVGFFTREVAGESVTFISPCRGTLVYIEHDVAGGGAVDRVKKALARHFEAAVKDDGAVDNQRSAVYGGLRRGVTEVTHFTEGQCGKLWEVFLDCSETGEDDLETGMEVYLGHDSFGPFLERMLQVEDFIPKAAEGCQFTAEEVEEHDAHRATLRGFFASEAVREGFWWLISDPVTAGYASMSPASKRLNRIVRFPRVLEAMNSTLFGSREQIVELIVQLIFKGSNTATRKAFRDFFASAFPAEPADEVLAMFESVFRNGVTTAGSVRYNLINMDVFNTWNMIILPVLAVKGWVRSNPDL